MNVDTVKHMTQQLQTVEIDEAREGIAEVTSKWSNREIIISAYYCFEFIQTCEATVKLPLGFHMVASTMGSIVARKREVHKNRNDSTVQMQAITAYSATNEKNDIERFWNLDIIGITEKIDQKDDELTVKEYEKKATMENGRYAACLHGGTENPNCSRTSD
ncbi:unnamed protein product [Gongylonema pulchrum]|uniref:Uncharacterized protein n=1 Tax=Gongylonema pulchrum TaxID=637853 RepID=A0A183D3K2_9BILA|nr:unnamed protein product [Gongylonema pulchrum]